MEIRNKYRARNRMTPGKAVKWYFKRMAVLATDWIVTPVYNEGVTPCFIVGCGHSGTTLVASKLARHPSVKTIGRETQAFYPNKSILYAKGMAREWIFSALESGNTVFVEKTPKHVHCIGRIQRLMPGAKFIFTARNPLDSVASLHRRFDDFSLSLDRWVTDNNALLDQLGRVGRDNRLLVRLEDLVADPENGFRELLAFLDLAWHPDVLGSGASVYDNPLADPNVEKRCTQVEQGIYMPKSIWQEMFSNDEVRHIREKTADISAALGYTGGGLPGRDGRQPGS